MQHIAIWAFAILMGFSLWSAANAQSIPRCGPASQMEMILHDQLGLTEREELEANDRIASAYVMYDPTDGRFIVLIYPEAGVACVYRSGKNSRFIHTTA